MFGLMLVLHIFIGSTLAGILVVVALVLGLSAGAPILGSAALGYVIAFPVSWFVAKAIRGA